MEPAVVSLIVQLVISYIYYRLKLSFRRPCSAQLSTQDLHVATAGRIDPTPPAESNTDTDQEISAGGRGGGSTDRGRGSRQESSTEVWSPFEAAVVYYHYTRVRSYFRVCLCLHAYGYCCFMVFFCSFGSRSNVVFVNLALLLLVDHT